MFGLGHGHSLSLAASRPLSVPFVGVLDGYKLGLLAAWSVWRRLFASYTGALLRVRRSTDNVEMDIGYTVAGFLDVTALLAFLGGASGYVHVIYAQDGSGLDYVQDVTGYQRQIVNAGTLNTLDGVATAEATGNQGYATAVFSTYTGTVMSCFVRAAISSSRMYDRVLSFTKNGGPDYEAARFIAVARDNYSATVMGFSGSILDSLSVTYEASFVASSILDGSNHTLRIGAASATAAFSGALDINQAYLGNQGDTMASGPGSCWSEAAVYLADKTADESAIRGVMTV